MKLLKFIIYLTLTLTLTGTISAQEEATDSANTLRDSVKQKVAEELSQIKLAVSKKGFLGSITGKNDASLTLSTWNNQNRSLIVSPDSVIKLVNGRDGTPADLKVGDYILAMGTADGQNVLTVSRLLGVKEPAEDLRQTFFGTVTAKTISLVTITTKDEKSLEFKLSTTTKYTGTTKSADIKEGAKIFVLAKGTTATPPVYSALHIHLFPSTQ